MAKDSEHFAHQQWLGYVQPVGLVVSIPALQAADAHVDRNIASEHQQFLACLCRGNRDELIPEIRNFPDFTQKVLGWEPADLVDMHSDGEPARSLEVALPEYNETLRPTWAVKEFRPQEGQKPWIMLVQAYPPGVDLDKCHAADERHWQASPQARVERLLRETEVPTGLLFNGTHIRLVYAPRGETSGHMTFPVAAMAEVAGRPMFAALHMLLEAPRLFSLPAKQRLNAILADSRKYQNVVSTQLAEQVLAALYELVRGFQAANDHRKGQLLADVLRENPDRVYAGLLTVLMRLVFLLYAEDRDLLSSDPIFANFYSVSGLFERLRADAGRYTDTMDQRYGAWAQLLTLFRMIYEGGRHGGLRIPARKGYLFDPDRYPFLEGRGGQQQPDSELLPTVSDGVVYRVLQNLLILDGERLSYRTLDVEQIGSVYETMMGFNLRVAEGKSIAVKPTKSHGVPATVNLEALLAAKPADRAKWVAEQTDQKVTGQAAEALKQVASLEDLLAALEKKIAWHATPGVVPKAAMILQPSDERRRSGSHYTPRSLTEPIVRTALRPVLQRLGDKPTPEQILELNVCDPAMGSGAFLVETCRQLGDELVKAWHVHNQVPKLPPDEDEILYARRLIAQRCLYGVDRNPMAVDLAKLSLWLATLAKDHPFTFLDHTLRAGDSLVGLSKKQIAAFHWAPPEKPSATCRGKAAEAAGTFSFGDPIAEWIKQATQHRQKILAARDDMPYERMRWELDVAEESLDRVRFVGDLVIAAYFLADKEKVRQERLRELALRLVKYLGRDGKAQDRVPLTEAVRVLRTGDHPVPPFHWEIEFPEVFARENPGYDAIIGNPPFLGGTLIGGRLGLLYHDYLVDVYDPATGLADIIAFFLRRAFSLLRQEGVFGLIATNTVAQGDTRSTGLEQIVSGEGVILQARRRYMWPGDAAVVVSVIHVGKTRGTVSPILDNKSVRRVSAFLLDGDADTPPVALAGNKRRCYMGTKIWGAGFVFEDAPSNGSSSLAELEHLITQDPTNREVVFAYIGGEEFNSSPTQAPRRFVIDFGDRTEVEARHWPLLFSIVEQRVKPVRANNKQRNYRENWWLHANRVEEAGPYMQIHGRLLALTSVSRHLSVAFVQHGTIIANSMVLILLHDDADFAVVQSRIHETWARFVGSSMKDDLRYTTPCFDTFPRPMRTDGSLLDTIGSEYYHLRARLMESRCEGLTATYNNFHDPNETSADILQLRELHAAMDRAVLDAYGWTDLKPTCEFLLDYEEEDDDEENGGESSGRRGRKKPWRYRWPDEFRDDVLARLLELNKRRAEEDAVTGVASQRSQPAAEAAVTLKENRSTRRASRSRDNVQRDLGFDGE